jgi:hypothetical protein
MPNKTGTGVKFHYIYTWKSFLFDDYRFSIFCSSPVGNLGHPASIAKYQELTPQTNTGSEEPL